MTRWLRFARVGLMGFAVQLASLQLLLSLFDMHYIVAVVLSVEAAILHNFVWHQHWTWRDRPAASIESAASRLLRFNLASGAVSLVGNALFTALFVSIAGLPVMVANIAAIACLTAVNFFVADRMTFIGHGPMSAAAVESTSAVRSAFRGRYPRCIVAAAFAFAGFTAGGESPADAAELTPEVLAAWNTYVARVEARLDREMSGPSGFLAADFAGGTQKALTRARLVRGEILVDDVEGGTIDIGAGTISHWRGSLYVPGVTVQELLDGVALRGRASQHRQDDVIESRVLSRDSDSLRLFLKLQRTAIVTVAYNTEHLVSYRHVGTDRAASRSVSTRIAELQDMGTPDEREKPVGQDRGFMWRLHSYWRYQQVTGGVVVELESLTLSRDVPWPIRAIARPIIDRIARESMSRTLASFRARFARQPAA